MSRYKQKKYARPQVPNAVNTLPAGLQRVLPASERGTDALPASASASESPLVTFRIVRSFAHQSERTPRLHNAAPGAAIASVASGDASTPGRGGGGGGEGGAGSVATGGGQAQRAGSILSFKDVVLELGPVDFTAHESFLTSVFSFAVQLPLQDVWQVRAGCRALCP